MTSTFSKDLITILTILIKSLSVPGKTCLKISKEFFQNPYVYLLDNEKVHEKIMRVTFEIIEEGGKAIDTGIPTTSGVTSNTDKQLDKVREA